MTDYDDDAPDQEYVPVDGAFTSLFAATEIPPHWVIDGLIPEGLTVVGGPPKDAKKSTLVMAVAALVAGYKCEVLPAEFQCKSGGPVMLWSYEADAGEIKHAAVNELGIKLQDDNGILVCDAPEEYMLDNPESMQQLLYWLDARKPRLFVIDPLRNAHTLDEKDSGELIQILLPVRRWCKRNSAACIVVHHTRKLDEDKKYTAQDLRGSSALYGLADAIIMITPTQKPMQFVYTTTFKRGRSWEKTLQLAAYETKGQRAGEALREVEKAILKSMERLGKPAPLIDIALDSAQSTGTLGPLLVGLEQKGYITHKRGVWSLRNENQGEGINDADRRAGAGAVAGRGRAEHPRNLDEPPARVPRRAVRPAR